MLSGSSVANEQFGTTARGLMGWPGASLCTRASAEHALLGLPKHLSPRPTHPASMASMSAPVSRGRAGPCGGPESLFPSIPVSRLLCLPSIVTPSQLAVAAVACLLAAARPAGSPASSSAAIELTAVKCPVSRLLLPSSPVSRPWLLLSPSASRAAK